MNTKASTLPLLLLLVAGLLLAACSDDDDGFGLDDGLPDDGDTGAADYCTEPEWGSGLTVGEPVANWSFNGYIDSNGDGEVEQDVVTFSLEDINCMGYNSLVLMIGTDT